MNDNNDNNKSRKNARQKNKHVHSQSFEGGKSMGSGVYAKDKNTYFAFDVERNNK
jgi:hypothetical protein